MDSAEDLDFLRHICMRCMRSQFFLMLSAFYKHRANIKRLLNGTENKFGAKKKQED